MPFQEKPSCLQRLKASLFGKISLTLIGPIKSYGLYYYDHISDIIFMVTLFRNCHKYYGIASLFIVIMSYISTVVLLVVRMKQKIKKAVLYPVYYGRNLLKQTFKNIKSIWNGENLLEEPDDVKTYNHCIEFFEAITESVPQLCLNCIVLREYGVSTDAFEGFIQISGLFSSLISTCFLFAKVSQLI